MSSFFRKMLTTLSRNKRTERMVGRDHFGNQYFEGVTYRDGGPKVVRRLEPAKGKDIYDFIGTENIPPLWNSWLRYYREDPPSDQEIEDDMKATLMRCQKIAEMEKLEQQRRAERELLTRTYKDVKIEKSDKGFPKYDEYELTPGQTLEDRKSDLCQKHETRTSSSNTNGNSKDEKKEDTDP